MEIKSAFVALGLLMLADAAALAQDRTSANGPQYGQWGFDVTGRDAAVKPGDDFFRHVNGAWLDRTEIPADKPAYTLRLRMTDTIEARLHDLMEQAAAKAGHQPADLEGKIGAYYRAYMDEARVEQLGAAPLKPLLDAVLAAKRRSQLSALMGRNNSSFNGTFFSLSIDADLKNPKIYSVYINQAGLGLPDRDYYLKPEFAAQKEQYKAYIARLLTLVGWPSPDERAADIVGVETAIANASWTKVQQRDPVAEYNPMTVDQLQAVTPDFDWHGFLSAAGLGGVTRVVVGEKSAVPKIAHIFRRVPIATLQAWQAFTIADNAAPFLSKPFNDAYFEMRKKTLSGQPEQEVRWKRAVHAVAGGDYGAGDRFDRFGSIGFGTGELYSAKYFPPAAKEKIEALVTNLKAAYRLRLQKLDWMGPATKEEALRKLDTYTIKVGYPDHPRDYSQLVIRDDDLLGDVERAGAIDWQFYVERLNQPVDRSDWSMTPQTNDAYNGSLRDIVFPAGILQPPIFDPNADAAINYGAAGGIIGHELTHGFDDEGRKIDAEGKLRDWWQPADAKQFEARAKQLGAQYSGFEPLPGVHVNGDLTMGENIADLGGLTLALDAYSASLHGQPAPVLDGLTGEQRVFIGWAQAWRGKVRDDYVKKQVVSDPHARDTLPHQMLGGTMRPAIPRQWRRAQSGRLVQRFRCPARRETLCRAKGPRADLVKVDLDYARKVNLENAVASAERLILETVCKYVPNSSLKRIGPDLLNNKMIWSCWIVTNTDKEKEQLQNNEALFQELREIAFSTIGFSPSAFVIQSQETVDRAYEGSWFYAMR